MTVQSQHCELIVDSSYLAPSYTSFRIRPLAPIGFRRYVRRAYKNLSTHYTVSPPELHSKLSNA